MAGGRVQLVNDEASRLLGLRAPEPGTLVADLGLPDTLAELLTDGRTAHDELHLGALGVVVVNQIPAHTGDVVVGRIVTLRDHTQLQALLGELDAVRSLASSLQAQTHEAANRLHTVVSLIEIGRPDRARAFAVSELQVAQALTDRVLGTVGDPVLSSLLLAKVAQAQERGVLLDLDLGDRPLHTRLPAQDVVTVVGNLLDNAIEAAHAGPEPRRVALVAGAGRGSVDLAVTNTGEGLDDARLARLFERGWTTKSEPGHGLGRPDRGPGRGAGRRTGADGAGPAPRGGGGRCLNRCGCWWSRTTRSRPRRTARTSTGPPGSAVSAWPRAPRRRCTCCPPCVSTSYCWT